MMTHGSTLFCSAFFGRSRSRSLFLADSPFSLLEAWLLRLCDLHDVEFLQSIIVTDDAHATYALQKVSLQIRLANGDEHHAL